MGQAETGAVAERLEGARAASRARAYRGSGGTPRPGRRPRRPGRSRGGRRRAWWCAGAAGVRRRRRRRVGTPAARWAASQPQRTSSPSGVRPVAAADQAGDGGRVDTRARKRRARPRGTGGIPLRRPGSPSEPMPHRCVAREHPRADRSPGRVRPSEGSHLQHKASRGRDDDTRGRLLRRATGSPGPCGPTMLTQRPATSRWTASAQACSTRAWSVGRGPQPRRDPRRGRHGEGPRVPAPGCSPAHASGCRGARPPAGGERRTAFLHRNPARPGV